MKYTYKVNIPQVNIKFAYPTRISNSTLPSNSTEERQPSKEKQGPVHVKISGGAASSQFDP